MNRNKKLAIAALAIAGAFGAGLAQARDRADVQWSITIGSPAPWAAPARVYNPPVRVYAPPPVAVYAPPVRIYEPAVRVYSAPRAVVYERPAWRGARGWERRDRDGDGIPNRYDRVYNPRWDRDGDGVPNRYDGHPNRPR